MKLAQIEAAASGLRDAPFARSIEQGCGNAGLVAAGSAAVWADNFDAAAAIMWPGMRAWKERAEVKVMEARASQKCGLPVTVSYDPDIIFIGEQGYCYLPSEKRVGKTDIKKQSSSRVGYEIVRQRSAMDGRPSYRVNWQEPRGLFNVVSGFEALRAALEWAKERFGPAAAECHALYELLPEVPVVGGNEETETLLQSAACKLCSAAGHYPYSWSLRHPGVTLARVPGGEVAFWGSGDVIPLWEHWLPQARRALAEGGQ